MTRSIGFGRRPFGLGLVATAAASRTAGAAQDRLVVAVSADVATLDPTVYHAVISFHARLNIFDGLTEITPTGGVVPRLAKAWEASADAKTWTFTIRRDAVFHNGAPVTIDDVIWSFQKIIDDPASPVRTYLTRVRSIDRVSDDQLRFNLTESFGPFDRQVMLIMIVPRKVYEKLGPVKFGQTPVGSGPYSLVRWVKDDRIELAAFAKYWGGAPAIKTATLKPVPSEASRAAALSSGEVDIVPALAPALVQTLGNKPGIKVQKSDSYKVVYLGFNPAMPALANLALRQAVDAAIDRTAITSRLLRGLGQPVGQIVAPTSFGYDASLKPTAYDVAKARTLVAQSGYKGEKIPLQYPNDFIVSADGVAEAIAGYLHNVGINVELQGMEYNTFYALWSAKKLAGIHLFVFGPILLDADVPIYSIFATSGNRGYLFDPRIDKLAAAQRAESDPTKRQELIAQLWRTANEYQPFSFLYNELQAVGLRDNVTWQAGPDGVVRLWQVKLAG